MGRDPDTPGEAGDKLGTMDTPGRSLVVGASSGQGRAASGGPHRPHREGTEATTRGMTVMHGRADGQLLQLIFSLWASEQVVPRKPREEERPLRWPPARPSPEATSRSGLPPSTPPPRRPQGSPRLSVLVTICCGGCQGNHLLFLFIAHMRRLWKGSGMVGPGVILEVMPSGLYWGPW